mmetsp:Transcript_11202/g.12416  ORF Transcript_11202/g.12416 Transcript_11202/m.12416 type:complete len:285 (-) Transcript_11202:1534-2388(-)
MRFPKAVPLITATTIASSSCFLARAFTSNSFASTRVVGGVSASALPKVSNKSFLAAREYSKSTALPMIFDKIFGGGGGGFNAKIDYTAIPFPAPQLVEMALEGNAGEVIEKNGKQLKLATFAGGCFWGLELFYQRIPGVEYTAVGYTQGPETEPTYDQVCAGATKHTEAVIVLYDPNECTYETLLDAFFDRVNPLTVNGQGNDYGPQYRTGVYYHSKEQQELAEDRFAKEQEKYTARKIASECKKALPFWPAEKHHQHYLEKGGRFSSPQSADKGCTDTIRCYG